MDSIVNALAEIDRTLVFILIFMFVLTIIYILGGSGRG